jgi:hypothetical protein
MTDRDVVQANFPRIDPRFEIHSPIDRRYNCIGWAAGDVTRRWWPVNTRYWPDPNERRETLDVFQDVFAALGYQPCNDGTVEAGYEKIVIYELNGRVTHMAKQIVASGWWWSKLGDGWDIHHVTPECLRDSSYGAPTAYMRRALAQP